VSVLILAGLVVLPATAGGALALGGRRAERAAAPAAVGVAVLVAVVAVTAAVVTAGGVQSASVDVPGFRLGIRVDGLSAALIPVVASITVLVLVFAAAEQVQPPGRFHGLMLLFLSAVQLTLLADTLPLLLAAWEVMGATSYALIGFVWRDRAAVDGGLVGFTVTRAADLGLYLATGAAVAGGFTLHDPASTAGGWRDVIAAGILLAALGKAAQLPFSFWLSHAMAGPSAVSALLHSAAMVAMGGYLLLRGAPLLHATGWAGLVTAWIGVGTAVLLGLVAVCQDDLKQLLAASTASQLGFVVLAAGIGTTTGGTGQLVAHAATKALLFLVAGLWLDWFRTRRLAQLRGAARAHRLVGVLATVGAAALAGLPPWGIWAAKDLVLAAAPVPLLVAGVLAALLSAAYAGRIVRVIWAPQPVAPRLAARAVVLPLTVLAAGSLGAGVIALPSGEAALVQIVGARTPAPSGMLMGATAVLAVAVFLVAVLREMPSVRLGRNWLQLEQISRALVVHPVRRLANRVQRVDDGLARAVHGLGPATLAFARRAGRLDTGLDRVVLGSDGSRRSLVAGTARLVQLAVRPQSGRVFDYFTFGVLAVGALVVVLLVVP
jgi:NADH:ubiquinone oxidoreductase subunit 5 (subunit L)/multisubunit Na+/H+ antiporter MnhA subunit